MRINLTGNKKAKSGGGSTENKGSERRLSCLQSGREKGLWRHQISSNEIP